MVPRTTASKKKVIGIYNSNQRKPMVHKLPFDNNSLVSYADTCNVH